MLLLNQGWECWISREQLYAEQPMPTVSLSCIVDINYFCNQTIFGDNLNWKKQVDLCCSYIWIPLTSDTWVLCLRSEDRVGSNGNPILSHSATQTPIRPVIWNSLIVQCSYRDQPFHCGCTNMLLSYAALHMDSCKCEMTDSAKGMTHWQLTVIAFPPVD